MLNRNTAVNTRHVQSMSPNCMIAVPDMTGVCRLAESDRKEILDFLSIRPVQTVVMASFIIDNGVVSDLNRGEFFAYRNREGVIEGVALIGHSTLVESRSEKALTALALQARMAKTPVHLIMGNDNEADRFYAYLSGSQKAPRVRCIENVFEAAFPFQIQECNWNVQNADISLLEEVAEAQAEIAFMESGVDPLVRDREGFLKRVARRIENGRVFTVVEDGKMIFKADIIAETESTIYLEGIFVHQEYRGKGIGSKCLAALTVKLLERVDNICLMSNVDHTSAHRSFRKAGYRKTTSAISIFV